jgi:hypothetical protein
MLTFLKSVASDGVSAAMAGKAIATDSAIELKTFRTAFILSPPL